MISFIWEFSLTLPSQNKTPWSPKYSKGIVRSFAKRPLSYLKMVLLKKRFINMKNPL